MTQKDMMLKDMLITTTASDAVLGPASKYDAHGFGPSSPRGRVHRAFSVFLFDGESRMLITKRAATKITFPEVWTNACCSHQIYGQKPPEVDDNDPDSVSSRGLVESSGAKRGAVRKLKHELGVDGCLGEADFHFLTRFHYWASDTRTYGPETEWGEHEIDYILFARKSSVSLSLNPEEVSDIKWVTKGELRSMFEDPELQWSPWFQGIMRLKGWEYWDDLEGICEGKGKHADTEVRFFDPPKEFYASFNK